MEAVVMLPLFLLLFGSVYYMHAHYSGRQQAMLTARSCLWQFAAKGCPTSGEGELKKCLAPNGAGEGDLKLEAENNPPPDRHSDATDKVAHVLQALEKIPVLGGAIGWLLGRPVEATALHIVKVPPYAMAKKGRYVAGGSFYTMCNSVPKSWGTMASDIFCSFLGKGTLGC